MKLLFTHSYFLRLDPKQWKTARPYPPLATLYAMAWLRQLGHRVELVDSMFADGPQAIAAPLAASAPDVLVIYDDNFNWLTKMCLSTMQRAALDMIRRGRAAGSRVVVCGSDASDHRQRYLEAGADAVLLGEGELTLGEVVAAFAAGSTDLSAIPGLAYLAGDQVVATARRPNLRDLDQLPSPAWDLVDLAPYERMWRERSGYWSLGMVSSRGCPYSCAWCAKPIWGSQYFAHSPERVVADLARLRRDHSFEHVWFADDIFALKPGWAGRFADLLAAAGITVDLAIQARADTLLRDGVVDDLVRAGLRTAWIGAESGSQKIVDAMAKGVTVEQVHAAVRLLQSRGVRVGMFLQFGYLGETRADIDQTVAMVRELVPDEIGVSVSYPLPGTPFYEQVKSQLGGKTNWTDSDDLALMYRGTYSPAFYRRLHRYVHKVFQGQRGRQALAALLRSPRQVDRRHLRSALATAYFLPAAALDRVRLARLESS